MIVVGYITGCVDTLHARTAVLVDQDAVIDLHTGAGECVRDWLHAKAHHDEVALDPVTALGGDPPHASGARGGSLRPPGRPPRRGPCAAAPCSGPRPSPPRPTA